MTFKPGDRVRMSEALKKTLRGKCGEAGKHAGPFIEDEEDQYVRDANGCLGCSSAHVEEFGECVGIVECLLDYNNVPKGDPTYDAGKVGPELDVRWQPSNLRYAYHPDMLEKLP